MLRIFLIFFITITAYAGSDGVDDVVKKILEKLIISLQILYQTS